MLLGTFKLVDSSRKEESDFQNVDTTFNASLRLNRLGPGFLIVEAEGGTKPIGGQNVSVIGGYRWSYERSSWGPGVKFLQNAADEKLRGTTTFVGGKWRF